MFTCESGYTKREGRNRKYITAKRRKSSVAEITGVHETRASTVKRADVVYRKEKSGNK